MKQFLYISLAIFFSSTSLKAQQLAFPSAEGFGRFATGGRGGTVYHVTNLNDSGPGSFRDAVSAPNRTVVFDVGGVIRITSRIVVSANVTIAGQTAPGGGITIYGNGLSYSNANNTITRYIRYRMGKIGESGKDAIAIADGHDMIFDHVSITWGRDGTFDLNGDVRNVTLQNSIIGQGLQTHSTGGLVQSTGGVSILRSLYIDNHTRNPKVKGYNQYINNVVYNWAVAAYILGDSEGYSEANVLNNYFIEGPETSSPPFDRANGNFHLYAANNYWDANRNGMLDGVVVDSSTYGPVTWSATPFDQPMVTVLSPQQAYEEVFHHVGASLYRDQVDSLLMAELASLGTLGQTISDETTLPTNGPGVVPGGPVYLDTDNDGMPDYYEHAVGLNAHHAADGKTDTDQDGYTNLEEYLNCLTGSCDITMPAPPARQPQKFVYRNNSGKNTSWDWPANWDLGYLPAAGDTAVIQTGTASVSGNKSGITIYIRKDATLNITHKTRSGKIYMEGGSMMGKDSLLADIEVLQPSRIQCYNATTFILKGELRGEEDVLFKAGNKIILHTRGEHFAGKIIIEEGEVDVTAAHALGTAYVEVRSGGMLQVSHGDGFHISFLEIEEGGAIQLEEDIVIPGGKLGDKTLRRARSYNHQNMPDYIKGNGTIIVSAAGTYDCTGTWNGTAYPDDCLVCVEGTTGRQPCDTSLETGAYTLTAIHSALCIQADSVVTQESCSAKPAQAIEIIKKGKWYQLRQLQSQLYILPYAYENGHLNLEKISLSPLPLGFFRIEKNNDGYNITPALRPDAVMAVEDSSLLAGTPAVVCARSENDVSQIFKITPYYDCSGERGGLAWIDACGFCAGGGSGTKACVGQWEAEQYCTLNGVLEAIEGRGYSGEGYLNYDNVVGSKATYNIISPIDRQTTLKVRYANGSGNRPMHIFINGAEQISRIDFPSTGGWANWAFADMPLNLAAGDNHIEMVSLTSAGAANIDLIIYTDSLSLGACPAIDCNGVPGGAAAIDNCGVCSGGNTGIEVNACNMTLNSVNENNVLYYPNTFSNVLHLKSSIPFDYCLYDQKSGQLIEQGHANEPIKSVGQTLNTGYYILHIIRNNKVILKATVIKH